VSARHLWTWMSLTLAGLLGLLAGSPTGATASTMASGQPRCSRWRGVPAPALHGGVSALAATSASDLWAIGTVGVGFPPIILHWDGAAWGQVPQEPMTGAPAGAVAISPADAWAVGADLANAPFSMHWDGSMWSQVSVATVGTFDVLRGITARSSTDIWAAGSFDDIDGIHPLVDHWDGGAWTRVFAPDGVPNSVNVLTGISAVAANDVWAVGYQDVSRTGDYQPLIEHWDGTSWTVVESPTIPGDQNELMGVTRIQANDIWTAGFQEDRSTRAGASPLVEHWDGTEWNVVSLPKVTGRSSLFFGISASSASDAWAVGERLPDGVTSETLTMHWDGVQWSIVRSPTPGTGGALLASAVLSTSDVWAGGSYFDPDFHDLRPLTMHSSGCQ
jgi:hypothetical protein